MNPSSCSFFVFFSKDFIIISNYEYGGAEYTHMSAVLLEGASNPLE